MINRMMITIKVPIPIYMFISSAVAVSNRGAKAAMDAV
jgi:hypothetical protein